MEAVAEDTVVTDVATEVGVANDGDETGVATDGWVPSLTRVMEAVAEDTVGTDVATDGLARRWVGMRDGLVATLTGDNFALCVDLIALAERKEALAAEAADLRGSLEALTMALSVLGYTRCKMAVGVVVVSRVGRAVGVAVSVVVEVVVEASSGRLKRTVGDTDVMALMELL
jgi:hypothetical protein